MKLASNANVLAFPAPKTGNRTGVEDILGQIAGEDDTPGTAFLEALEASVSNAADLIEAAESDVPEQSTQGDGDPADYDGWVDYGFFGTLLGRVEAKYQEACQDLSTPKVVDQDIEITDKKSKLLKAGAGEAQRLSLQAPETEESREGDPLSSASKPARAELSSPVVIAFDPARMRAAAVQASAVANVAQAANGAAKVSGDSQAPQEVEHPANVQGGPDGSDTAEARKSSPSARFEFEPRQRFEAQLARKDEALPRVSDGNVPSRNGAGDVAAQPVLTGLPGAQTPAAQISNNILQAVPMLARPLAGSLPDLAKSFRFKLHPEELGQVGVSLKLQGGKMTLTLSADEAAAADLLEADKEKLKAALTRAGAGIDVVEVSVVLATSETSSTREMARPQADGTPQGQQNLSGSHSNGSQRQRDTQANWARDIQHEDGSISVSRPARDGASDRRAGIYL